MQADNQRIIERLRSSIINYFCRSRNVLLPIPFGSRATGSAREDSDFDLA